MKAVWKRSWPLKIKEVLNVKLEELVQELEESIEELIRKGNAKAGSVLVIGCSTSEILGNRIGAGAALKQQKLFLPLSIK